MAVRTYPTPNTFGQSALPDKPTMDEIDWFIQSGLGTDEQRSWASSVRSKFVSSTLDSLEMNDALLPIGIAVSDNDVDVVVGLQKGNLIWKGLDGWKDETEIGYEDASAVALDENEVAFVAAALLAGHDGLALCASIPRAFARSAGPITAAADVPAGAKVFAVIDELDETAVLDVLALLPGPKVMRRHDGQWIDDSEWLRVLSSVKPPKVHVLQPGQIEPVLQQIDQYTDGEEIKASGEPFAMTAAAARELDMRLEWTLLAGAGRMPTRLKIYWGFGKGSLKIRWGTPGAFGRCQKQLRKHMPPYMVNGACANLGKLRGGRGIAYAVGD